MAPPNSSGSSIFTITLDAFIVFESLVIPYCSVEVVQESCDALKCLLLLVLYLDGKLYFGLYGAAKVGYRQKVGHKAYRLARLDCLTKLHLVHAVVDHHLEIVDLDDLVPKERKHRQCEITVGYGCLERTFNGSLLRTDMNPLVVECCVGKKVDTLLCQFHIVGNAYVLAKHCGKLFIIVDNYFAHNSIVGMIFLRI